MRKSIQLRWIEHKEAKSCREHASLWRAASELPLNFVSATSGPGWAAWPRAPTRAVGYTVTAVRSLSVTAAIWAKRTLRGVCSPFPKEVDGDRVLLAVLITDIVELYEMCG